MLSSTLIIFNNEDVQGEDDQTVLEDQVDEVLLPSVTNIQNTSGGWWAEEAIGSSWTYSTGFALDLNGVLHISYMEYLTIGYERFHLVYAKRVDNVWTKEYVESHHDFVGSTSSLAVDPSGKVYIAYYYNDYEDLKIAARNGTGWDISTIESSSDSGNYPSLVLDSNDRPIISYYKATGTTIYLRLARWNGTGWDLSTVDTNVGLESSIAIGSNDELHISYKKIGQPGGLGYAYWNNTTWNITIVDEYHYRVYYPSISLDSKERPHIAYYDFYDKDLLYAYKNGTGWNISKLEEENETGNYPSIVVDEDDHPHIVFSNQSTGQVIYIHWDGGKWIREVLSDKIGKYHGAILLDERDVPLIVQRVGSQGMTLFRKTYERINVTTPAVGASWSRGQTYFINWSTENLLNGSTVDLDLVWFDEHERSIASGLNASLGTFNWTLPTNVRTGSRHRVRIRYDTWSYVMGFSGEFNVPQEKGWYFDTVEKQLSGPISLVLDKNETPTIGFYSDGVKFSKWDVDHWSNVTVDNSTLLLYGLDMDLDSNDMPHYAYYDYTNRDLIYTRWNGTAWEKTTVDSSGDVGYFCSIAIDGSDNPHISYYDSTNANLKYAEWNGRQFNTETVDTFTVRRASDIKINSTDKPHIAYKDLRNGDMKLASRNGSGWDVQIVDAISYSLAPSLAIDEEDNFHIAYRGGGQYYAHWNGSGWSVEEIEGSINGVRPALDIDSEGYPHIIYQVDNDDHDYLQYTKWNGTGWESEMLIGLSNTYHSPWFNIELDSNDTPHIAFYREDGNGLEYGYKQSNATVPSSVSNLRVRESENGAFLEWDPPYEDGGLVILTYSLYRGNSTENLTFVGNISIDRTNYSDAIVEHNTDYYYAIIAVNSVGEANIVDAVKFKISIPVLFVDDDDGADHDSYFKAALNRTDHRYFEWDIYDSGPIGYANLSLYDVVIWATGDRASNTLTTTDQANLIDYLNGSGRLYLSSQDLFFDITSNTDGAVTNTFVNDFLEITSVDNDVNYGSVQGRSGDIITDPLGTVSLSVPYTNYGDEFTIGAEGSSMLTNPSSGNDVGVKVDNESFRVVFTSFGFEGIQRSNSTKGSEFMERTLEWLISEPGSPSPPTNITLNSASGFVHLIWDGPIETGLSNISRYNIYRTNTSADPVHYNWTTGSTLEFNDTSVIEGEVYRYMVTAANDVGESLPTDTLLYDQVSPVFVSNTSGGSATTGETMEINVTVTDNFEVGDVKMEYWFGSGAHVNESLGGSNPYTITLDIPNESHDDLNYFLTATDIAGNKAIDHMMYVLVTDNDRPVLENDNTPSFGTTGEGVTFAIDASDNVGIGSIFVEYWFGTGAHTNVTMTGESTFSYSISLPNNSTDPMHYLFSVKDTSFLWKTTSTEDVTITDNDLPYYGVDRTQNIGYTGDPHIFSIEVFDNVGVKYTMLNFWYNDGVRNISTQMGGAFPVNTTTATLPLYLSGTLYYYFTAYDESWNMYNSSVSAISVYDDILPVFGTDSTPTTRYTGEDLTFTISATDNVEIDEINVEYWVGTGAHSNVSMTGSDPYYLTLNGPWTSLDVIHYIFHASDPDGNWAHTSVKDITIIDNEKPVIGQDLTDTAATTGDSMLFSIAATDNINVDTVILHYQINGGPIVNITMTGTSTFIYQAVMPWNITGTLSYRIGVNDTSDNWNWTAQKFVTISDNDAPTFGTDVTPSAGFTGEEFTFEVAIIDNIMIQEASVEYWFGTGTHLILPLTDPSPYQITVTVHLRSTDTLHYLFNVNDTSDNQASTLQKDVSIVDDRRPELVSDLTPASTSTGDDLLIEVTLSDNIAMGEAYLEFWFGTQGSVNLTMTGTDLVSWNLSVEIALNSVEELHYLIHFNDSWDNWNQTGEMVVMVMDSIDPVLLFDDTSRAPTTGDKLFFSVVLVDNIYVVNASLSYWFGLGTETGLILTGDNQTWTGSIIVPAGSLDKLHYLFIFSDDAGNNVSSTITTLTVIDNDRPLFGEDSTSINATTGDDLTFFISVSDNIGIVSMKVEYRIALGEWVVLNMTGPINITIPSDVVGILEYTFLVTDTSGNADVSETFLKSITDNDGPEVTSIIGPGPLYSGDELRYDLRIKDNIGIANVSIYYEMTNLSSASTMLELQKDGGYIFTLSIPHDFAGWFIAQLTIYDLAGNQVQHFLDLITVIDNIDPEMDPASNMTIYEGDTVDVNITAMDNILVSSIEWTGAPIKIAGTNFFWIADQAGIYNIIVVVVDGYNNSAQIEWTLTVLALDNDRDDDGIPDLVENEYGLDMKDPTDGGADLDGDGLTNKEEYEIGTGLNDEDTDSDGMPDKWEHDMGLDPTLHSSDNDADGDGDTDLEEYTNDTDPNVNDKVEGKEGVSPIIIGLIVLVIIALAVIGYMVARKKEEIAASPARGSGVEVDDWEEEEEEDPYDLDEEEDLDDLDDEELDYEESEEFDDLEEDLDEEEELHEEEDIDDEELHENLPDIEDFEEMEELYPNFDK